jgi:hypothetical protein
MSLEQAIAEARERLQVKESLEELRKAIRAQFGEDIGHWIEPAYVISSEDTPEARFTHNGVCLSLWRDDEGWGVSTDQTNERLSGDWEDTDEACDELLVLIDDLATAQSA